MSDESVAMRLDSEVGGESGAAEPLMFKGELSRGALLRALNSAMQRSHEAMLLQVMEVKSINTEGAEKRYRVIFSDGDHFMQGMLATQTANLVTNGKMAERCIVRVENYVVNSIVNRKVLIVLAATVMEPDVEPIGNPTNVEDAAAIDDNKSNVINNNNNNNQQQQQQQARVQPNYGGGRSPRSPRSPEKPEPSSRPQVRPKPAARRAMGGEMYHPLSSLNPYGGRWVVRVRCVSKGSMRTWNNARGEGKLFSVDFLDGYGSEMRATMFNDAADKFFPLFEVGQVYRVAKGSLKIANSRWNKTNSQYEMTLNMDAEVERLVDDQSIEQAQFDFKKLSDIEQTEPDTELDVAGVVVSVSPLANLISQRTKRELTKRTVTLVDESGVAIELTIWGDDAKTNTEETLANNPVMAIKRARVSDFGGRSLNTSFGGQMYVNLDHPRVFKLRAWYDNEGRNQQHRSLSGQRGAGGARGDTPTLFFEDVNEESLGHEEKADYFNVQGTFTFLRRDKQRPPWYKACPTETCRRKLTEEGDGFHCVNCDRNYAECDERFVLSVIAADCTGQKWLTLFNDVAASVLGTTAKSLARMLHSDDTASFDRVFADACFNEFNIVCRAKSSLNDQERRLQLSAIKLAPLDYANECNALLKEIATYD